jgi:hypothetical protein
MSVYAVEGSWVAFQSNGPQVTFNLTRDGVLLSGTASYSGGNSQDLKGRLSDNRIVITVTWNANSVGEYNGFFGVDDRLTGHTFDLNHPESQATWFTTQGFTSVA